MDECVEAVYGGRAFLFDFPRMVRIDAVTVEEVAMGWINDPGACFFPVRFGRFLVDLVWSGRYPCSPHLHQKVSHSEISHPQNLFGCCAVLQDKIRI